MEEGGQYVFSVIQYRQRATQTVAGEIWRKVRASQGRMLDNVQPEQSAGKRNRNYTAVILVASDE